MDDRELLELAAKAEGINLMDTDSQVEAIAIPRYWDDVACMSVFWNPLADDGDALRLAVKLEFIVDTNGLFVRISEPFGSWLAVESKGEDHFKATRRAIVRAAAEIGRKM